MSYRNTSGSLEEREMICCVFRQLFEFSQTSTGVSIGQLDYELEISIERDRTLIDLC